MIAQASSMEISAPDSLECRNAFTEEDMLQVNCRLCQKAGVRLIRCFTTIHILFFSADTNYTCNNNVIRQKNGQVRSEGINLPSHCEASNETNLSTLLDLPILKEFKKDRKKLRTY
jgi:hypothetical protein